MESFPSQMFTGVLNTPFFSILVFKTEINAVAKKGSSIKGNVEAIREKFGQYSRFNFYLYQQKMLRFLVAKRCYYFQLSSVSPFLCSPSIIYLSETRFNRKWWLTENTESLDTEAATKGVLCKKVFLEISQNSQENTCARVIKLQALGLQLY